MSQEVKSRQLCPTSNRFSKMKTEKSPPDMLLWRSLDPATSGFSGQVETRVSSSKNGEKIWKKAILGGGQV